MFWLEPTPKQLLLSAVLIPLWIEHVVAQGDPLLGSTQFPCYNSDNYTSNSTFQTNLNILFSSLVSNGSQDGFFNTSVGVSPDIVYGLVQCRGDISRASCRSCLSTSAVEVIRYCPNRKVAARRYDHCIMRYSNVRFFSQLDTNVRSECSPTQVSDADAGRFEEQLRNLLTNVTEVAAPRPNRFGSETAVDNSTGKTVFGWVQCNQDLSPTNCISCVENLISEIPDRCDKRPGAKIFSATCYLRFEQYSFTIAPPPPAIALSPPPPAIALSPPPTEPRERDGSGNGNIPESAKGKSSTNAAVIIVPTIASALLLGTSVYLIRRKIKKNVRNPTPKIIYDQDGKISISAEPLQFDLNTIRTATNNFSDANKLGEGGFGAVYKGECLNGQKIAVKRLSEKSRQGSQEFKNEVILLHKLEHRNLVRLLGFCLAGEEKLLVYEYLPKKSLDKYIFDSNKTSYLNWESRYKIIGGIARALLYLHEESRLRIIHRDIKAGNVLLDEEMNAKVADFGLAKLFGANQTRDNTRRVAGTLGYMPPEYLSHGLYSIKSDVFNFGVLLLEIVSGQSVGKFERSGPSWTLLSYAWKAWREANPLDLMYPVLVGKFSANEATRCIHIALLCVQQDMEARPSMSYVVLMLNSYSLALESPSAPAFIAGTITITADPTGSLLSNDEDLTLPR